MRMVDGPTALVFIVERKHGHGSEYHPWTMFHGLRTWGIYLDKGVDGAFVGPPR